MQNMSIEDCYRNLGAAIVLQALEDYQYYKSITPTSRRSRQYAFARKKMAELEEFFESDWCNMLAGIAGDAVKTMYNGILNQIEWE